MGPNNAWDLKTNSRGTQTDLVTDRNISDCLMELKSTPEFEDLSYRVSETCTGEPCITVTHSKAIGLLGVPLDPLTVTVTASGLCYFSVLFQPIEVINLKPGSELLLRKFRNVLRKLSGKAGFGFCSGFSQKDFPSCFDFIKYDIEVIHQPFLRIHSRGCPIFYQQRRPRVTVPDLGVELCPECLQARSVLNKLLKAEDDDKSASTLVLNNHVAAGIPSADIGLSPHESLSQIKGEPEPPGLKPKEINSILVKDAKPVYLSHAGLKNEHERLSENLYLHASDPAKIKTEVSQTQLESTMLCDSSIPSPTFTEETDGISDVGVSKEETSSPSSPPSSPPIPSPSAVTSTTSASLSSTSPSPMAPSSPLPSSPCPMTVGTVVTASANLSKTRDSLNNAVENSLSQTVLSARIRPFRAIASHIQESGEITAGVVRNDVELSTVQMSMDGPLINGFGSSCKEDLLSLNSEDSYSPDSSPRPLLIDEDADCSNLQTTKYGELDAKQLCLRCSICQQVSTSQADLNRHVISHHNQSETIVDVNTTISVFTATTPSTTSQDKNGLKPVVDNLHLGMENEAIDQVSKTCPVCKVQFADKSELEYHLIDKHGAKLHPCRYCGQKFALKNNLTSHLQRHRGHTTLKCNECGAKFSKRKVFAAHIRQHMGSFPYFCTICTKLFSLETSFEKHMKRHKARRSTGVLTGNERTVHGILVKAKKLLDEKFQLEQLSLSANSKQGKNLPLPSSEKVCKNSEEVNAKIPECFEQSLSFTSESHDSVAQSPKATLDQKNMASSNLHLLSVVSVAQAELLGTYSANSAPNQLKQRAPEYLKPHLIDTDILSVPVPSPSQKTKVRIDPHSQYCEISESERSDIVLNCDVSASQGKIGSVDFPSSLPVPPPLRKSKVGNDLHSQNCEISESERTDTALNCEISESERTNTALNCEISESERTNTALNCDVPTSPEKIDANLLHSKEENTETGMQIGQTPEIVTISDDCSVKCDQNSTSTLSSPMIDVQTCVNLANVENKMAEKVEQEQYKKKCSNSDTAAMENIIEDNNSKLVLQEDSSKDLQKRPKTLLQRLSAPPLSLPRPVSGVNSSSKSFMEASEWSEMQPDILPIDGLQQKTSGENAEENEIQQKSPSVMPSCLTVEAGMTEIAQKLMEQEQRLAKKEKELKEREAAIALKDRHIQQRLLLAKFHSMQQKCSTIKESSTVGSLSGAGNIAHTIPQMQAIGAHGNNSIPASMPGRSHKIHPIVSRAVSGTGSMQLQNLPPPPPPPPYPSSQVTSGLRPVGHLAPQYMNQLVPGTREVMNKSLTHISPPAVQKSHTHATPSSQVQGSHCITTGTQPLTVATSEANFSLPSSWTKTTLILNGSTGAPPPLVSSTLTYSPEPFGSMLKEMMRLEAKMPETAKKFLPSYGTRKQSSKKTPVQLSCLKETKDLSTVSSAGFTSPNIPDMVLSLASSCTSDSNRKHSSKGRQSLNDMPFSSVFDHSSCNDGQHQASGSDAKNRRHQWSGGIFKEKSSSVPVAVSPSEMQRLLTLVSSSSSSPSHSDVVSTLSPPMPLPMPPPPPYPSSCQPSPVCSQKAIQPSLSLPSSLNSHLPLILNISAVPTTTTTTPSLFTTSPVTASGVTPRFLLQPPLSTPPGAVLHRNMQTTHAPPSFDAVPRLPTQPASFSVLHHNNQHIFSSPVTSTITTNLTVTSPRLPFSSSSHSQGSHSSFISSPASSGPPPLWMPGRKRTPVSTARASADDMVPIDLTKPKHVTSVENKKQNHNSSKNNNESPSTESSLLLRQCLMMSPLVDRSHFANSESSPQTAEYSHSEMPTNHFGPPPIVRFPLSSHPVTNPHATLISKGIGSSDNRSTEYVFSPASTLSSKTSSLSQGILTSQKNMAPLVAQSQDVLQNHDLLQHGIVSPPRNGISRTQDATSVSQRVLSPHRSVRIPTSGILSPHGMQQEVLHPPCVPSPHCALSPIVTSTQNVTTHPRTMFPVNSATPPSASGHRSSVPNFLQLPSFSANIGQKDVHGFNLDKCSLSNPLGGFAWHKPEIGETSEQSPDVFIHESSSENKSYQRETITLEGNANEPEINMVDARCLEVTEKGEVWQRQFLTALQQNRQQKQQQQEKQQQSQLTHQQERQQLQLAHQQERQQQLQLTHQQERQQLQLTHHQQGQQQSQFTHQQERQQQQQLAHQQERQQQSQLMQHQQERQQQSLLMQHQQKSDHQSQLTHQQREHQHSQFLCEQDKLQQPLVFQHQQERQQHSYVIHQQEQQVQPGLYQQEKQQQAQHRQETQQAQHRQETQQTQLMHDLPQRPEEPIQQNQHSHSKDSTAMELQPELGSKLRRTRRSRKRLVEKSEEKHPANIEYSKKREHYRVDTTGKDLRIRLVSAEGRPPKLRRKNGTSRKDGKEEGHDMVESNVIDGKPEEAGEKIIDVTGRDAEAKVEPTVSCDACGKLFFNELDILEHECDVE